MKRENFSIIIFIIVDVAIFSKLVNANKNFCTSTECIHASASILERINPDINPCDNFYDFACGAFIDDTLVPDERVSIDVFGQLNDNIDQQLNSFIKKSPRDGLNKIIHELYTVCINNTNKINRNSVFDETKNTHELRELINSVGGWPIISSMRWDGSEWTINNVILKIRKILGFREDKIFDIKSNSIVLRHPNIPLVRTSKLYPKYRRAFFKYLKETVRSFESTLEIDEKEIDDILEFEHKLNKLNYRLQQTKSSIDVPNESKEFFKTFLQLQWLNFFHASPLRDIYIDQFDELEPANDSIILNEINNLLKNTSERTLANFLIWRLIDYAGSQVIGSVKFSKFQLERTVNGKQDMDQSWKQCIDVIKKDMPYAIGWQLTTSDDFELKKSATKMLSEIKYELNEAISNCLWIDSDIRIKLQQKLEDLNVFIAYPNSSTFDEAQINDFYEQIEIDKNQYIRTLLQLRIIDADHKFRETYTSLVNDVDNWKKYLPPISLAAVYSEFENSLRLSYSIIMNIINQDESLKYLNFGTIGFIIGHEISHIVNQFINQANTWPEKFRNEFTAKKQCVIKQYDSYQDPETLKNLDGKRTVSENIADLMGIKLAYSAYRRWDIKFNSTRHKLIGVNFTENQLFWIVMAQTFCGVFREEEMERKISSDIYAIERFRVIGTVENSPDFFSDFKCSESSKMNHENKCIIW